MQVRRMRVRVCFGIGTALCLLAACSPQISVHGYVPTETELATIETGIDTRASLSERIGEPANTGLLTDSDWYYIQTTFEQRTYNPPEITDRQVVAIGFDDDGVVEAVDRYGLEDGRIIDLNTRVTVTGGQRRGVLARIFGSILNLDAGSLLGN